MRAAIYVRVSTVEQATEGYSISAQISLLTEYAKMYQYDVVKIYEDAGISGKNITDRPSINRLIKDATSKKFDIVLVWKLSRLSRSLLDLLGIVDTFTQNNISFHSYTEKFDTSTPMGKMLLQLLGSIAEFERNTIAENVKMGLGERFKQGYSKGAIPFGYKSENKKAVIVPEQAEIVQYIFEDYINNGNLVELAEDINGKGFRTRTGGLWGRISLRDMLINHFYMGKVRTGIHSHGKKYKNASVQDGMHEAIITEELFSKVNDMIDSKKHEKVIRKPDNDSILTGLLVCPNCGSKMFALNTYNRYTNKAGALVKHDVRIYRCNEHDKGKNTCKGFYVSGRKIEPQTINILSNYISDPSEEVKKEVTINSPKDYSKELKSLYALKNKYFELFERGKVKFEAFEDKINEILSKIDEIESIKPVENISHIDILARIKSFIDIFDNLTNIQKKEFLRAIVDEVHIGRDKQIQSIKLKSGILLS